MKKSLLPANWSTKKFKCSFAMKSLRNLDFFNALDGEQFSRLENISRKLFCKKGNILFYEKEMSSSLLVLIEGVVKIYKSDLSLTTFT